ncbi:MAG: 50S ribosomal protein L9 [Leptospiraceae bacterium]|nr:50S ribosomal protein L9 [Leptospiraceae bacterium]
MKVILQKDYTNLGDAGDIKEVSDGYARNFLIPKRIAIRADEGSTKAALHQKKLIELKKDSRKKSMEGIADSLKGKQLEIKVKVGENDKLFGSVTPADISKLLKSENIDIDKRKIELLEHIKALGSYQVKIKLAEGIQPIIQITVSKAE